MSRPVGRHADVERSVALVTGQSAEQLREHIAAQLCPWCARGPFKNLGLHTAQMHDTTADELRMMADMPNSAPTCSEGTSDAARLAAQRTNAVERVQQATTDDARRLAARRASETWARVNRHRNAEILEHWDEGLSFGEIADALDMHPKTVAAIVKRFRAEDIDGRERAAAARGGEALRKATAVWVEKRRQDREAFIACYRQVGTVERLAQEYGVSVKSAHGRLKKYGIQPPDRRPAAIYRAMAERRAQLDDERDRLLVRAITPSGTVRDAMRALGVSHPSATRRMRRLVESGWVIVVKARDRGARTPAVYKPSAAAKDALASSG